jgi:predicted 2-oxoglutarate/Fe(II)-dependent dioxygenase YbiX
MIRVEPEWLGADECARLIELAQRERHHADFSSPQCGWSVALPVAYEAREHVLGLIHPHTLETLRLHCMGPGQYHGVHRDSEQLVEGRWVPNHTPHRVIGAIVYLSEGFAGGQLIFDDLGMVVTAKLGLAVTFGARVTHQTTPVESGLRYALTAWGTRSP